MTTQPVVAVPALLDIRLAWHPQVTAMYLSANDRGHWRTRETRRRYWLDTTIWQLRAAAARPLADALAGRRAHVVVTFSWPDRRRRDVANLQPTAKVILDAVVRAGILPDDHDELVVGPDCRRGHGPHEVRLTITREVTP